MIKYDDLKKNNKNIFIKNIIKNARCFKKDKFIPNKTFAKQR
jgi:hypothetical protein